MLLQINYVTSKGDGLLNEDSYIINDKILVYGVADGVSSSLVPFQSKDGHTGGYIASNMVKSYFESLKSSNSLLREVSIINERIRNEMKQNDIDFTNKQKLWGTALAIVKILENGVEFIQTGDCMILAVFEDGEVRPLTRLQVLHLENPAINKWQECVQKGITNRAELMDEVKEIILSNRNKSNCPDGYGVLNGEHDAMDYVEYGKINKIGLKSLILITDGMLWPENDIPAGLNYWDYIAKVILQKGIVSYMEDLFRLEKTDPDCLKYPRFKQSDDKAGIVLHF
jgi:serine/threonine protein phosphatase PrpC